MYDSPTRTHRDRQTEGSRRGLAATLVVAALLTAGVSLASLGPAATGFVAGALAGGALARVTARRLPALVGDTTTYRVAGLDIEVAVSTVD